MSKGWCGKRVDKEIICLQVPSEPASAALLKTGRVRGHRRLFRKRLKAVATDRGFYSQANEKWLRKGGVAQVSIPVRGKTSRQRRRAETAAV